MQKAISVQNVIVFVQLPSRAFWQPNKLSFSQLTRLLPMIDMCFDSEAPYQFAAKTGSFPHKALCSTPHRFAVKPGSFGYKGPPKTKLKSKPFCTTLNVASNM